MYRKSNNIIVVNNINKNKGILTFCKNGEKVLQTTAFIGKNGLTRIKVEGDGKTPIGRYELGICFGTHKKEEISIKNYIQINENLYWIDDVKSKFYNQMVDITKVHKDWRSAEHLIEYPNQYEYALEIKAIKEIFQERVVQYFCIVVLENQQVVVLR